MKSGVSVPAVFGVSAGLVLCADGMGAELQVPSKAYPTIQSAIDAAAEGDTVVIAAGVFAEKLLVENKSVSLVGAGKMATILDAKGIGGDVPVLFYRNSATQTPSTISGLTIQNGMAGGLIVDTAKNLTIRDCEIRSCSATYGGGAICGAGSDALFERVTFRENHAVNGGAVNTNGFVGVFRSCVFENNVASNEGGAFIDFLSSTTLVDCDFRNNQGGAGVVFSYIGSATSVGDSRFCGQASAAMAACCGGNIVDLGGNFVQEECASECPGDLSADGVVNGADASVLLKFWGTDGSGYPGVDLDGDGIVGAADLTVLLNSWGACAE